MPYLLPFIAVVRLKIASVYSFAEGFECGEFVTYARLGELGAEARFMTFDREAQDMVFVRCDAGLGEEEIVREKERKDGSELSR